PGGLTAVFFDGRPLSFLHVSDSHIIASGLWVKPERINLTQKASRIAEGLARWCKDQGIDEGKVFVYFSCPNAVLRSGEVGQTGMLMPMEVKNAVLSQHPVWDERDIETVKKIALSYARSRHVPF